MHSKQRENEPNRTRKIMKTSMPPRVATYELALASWPIFGGTAPGTTAPPATAEGQAAAQSTQQGTETAPPAGGEAQKQTEDPVAKLQSDPNAISQLLDQLNKTQADLQKIAGERDQFVQEKQQQERAQQTKEQQLQTDLDNANATIEKMDRVIRQTALTNAFLAQSDYQWNSLKQAMSELSDDEVEIQVDLDGGKAEVTGMENAVKRISQQSPWLLKSGGVKETQSKKTPQRGSGLPPAPPAGDESKKSRRQELMKKFPALQTGRG